MSSQSPAAIHLQILLNKANERIKELEAEETRLTGLVSLYFNSIKSRNEYIAQLEAELASLRDTSRTLALLDAERIKELEAECVAAKDYMVKCGEQSSLDAKRIAELEAAARWIAVEERLPKYGQPVLVMANGVVQEAVYMLDGADDCADWFECMADEEITFWANYATHWTPLPQPPSKGE